jgi:serine/threonine-protein kinase
VDPVLGRALAKNPHDRFPSCTDFANALRSAVEAVRPRAPLPPSPMPVPPAAPSVAPPPPRQQQTAMLPADLAAAEMPEPPAAIPQPSRWPWALAGVALVMLLGALVFAVWPRSEQARTAPATTSTSRPATTSPTMTTTTTSAAAVPVTFESMREAVTSFYGQLPADAAGAWDKLDANYQQRNGRADYLGFWSTIQSVSVLSVAPRDANSVVATIRYLLKDGRVDTENRWLSVVARDGRLLIYDSERIGPA